MPSKKAISRRSNRKTTAKKQSHLKNKVEVLSSKTVFQGRIFSVTSDRVQEPGGIVVQRDIVRHGGSVVILAVDDSGPEPHILMERQYRYAAGDVLWELPAGCIDRGESPLAGARRELLEETGYRAKIWSLALHYYPSPGFVDETMTIYLASGLTQGPAHPEEDEFITCELVPLSRALKMVLSGRICDGKTIAGVLWLAQFLSHRKPRP
jgi:ADP-ribose pyrophosphatase